ncbi:MAG: DNA polymerase III subunit delta [Betaproteobacteria bacterium]
MPRRAEPGRSAPVHLVLGEDSYLAEQALERILAAAIGEDRNDALTVLQGDEVRWEAVVAAARSGSLFASRRAVVVRRADLVRSPRPDEDAPGEPAARKGRAKAEEDPLLRYLDDPSPDVTLVLLAARPDRRRNPWKRVSSEAAVHSAEPKKGQALRAHVEAELRERGLRLEPDAVEGLIDEVGQDLRRLIGELDKLEAWGDGRDRPLTADDVHAVLGRSLGRPLYLLADSTAARDLGGSLQQLEQLLDGGEEGLRILATLHRSLRQVRAAGAMLRARAPRAAIAAALLPANMQWKIDSLLDASRRWSDAELRRALAELDRADRRMKRGADASTALLAALVVACGGGGAASAARAR